MTGTRNLSAGFTGYIFMRDMKAREFAVYWENGAPARLHHVPGEGVEPGERVFAFAEDYELKRVKAFDREHWVWLTRAYEFAGTEGGALLEAYDVPAGFALSAARDERGALFLVATGRPENVSGLSPDFPTRFKIRFPESMLGPDGTVDISMIFKARWGEEVPRARARALLFEKSRAVSLMRDPLWTKGAPFAAPAKAVVEAISENLARLEPEKPAAPSRRPPPGYMP